MASEVLHLSSVVVVWSVLVHSLHDLVNMATLVSSVDAHQNNEHQSEARFLSESLGGSNSVSPDHHLSAFTNSANLGENEEENGGQSLEGIVELELLVSDELWMLWSMFHILSSVVRMVWSTVSTVDHVVGVFAGRHHLVEGDSHTNDTDHDERRGSVLDSRLVLLNVGLGSLQLLDGWVNWGLLQGA